MTKKWLGEENITTLEWPPQSPDLNPIENAWVVLERQIRKREKKPTNKNELWEMQQEEWYKLDPEYIKSFVESMPRRVQCVIKAKGRYIKGVFCFKS
jgi:DDE superfamily endonuclease